MFKTHAFLILATAATLGAGCARSSQSAAGDVFSTTDAAKTVTLNVANKSSDPMELRTIVDGRSMFIGSVSPNDTASILLDPTIFPTGFLYITAIPPNGRGRAVAGPLAASKGDKINMTINPGLDAHAIVTR